MNRCPVIIDPRFVEDLEEELFSENGSKPYDEDSDGASLLDVRAFVMGTRPYGGVYKLDSMTGSWVAFYEPMTSCLNGSQQSPVNVSIVPISMHLELQGHHRLILNEALQPGLDENS